ncbi:hypothetical protein BO82DRAFT_355362 [Aspergillus uvarum CBS 121591]|uniref:PLAC8-domain-containing protein n=1 Tax=Aspergillus uvarum CBS 121591 TaxID=1448315 RepID=A0A319C632_9EURO|nr:hypothetical protein BO82DRAFT_355362 [Aspergillus uvarum CBS 121591]PYH80644.1 hypothetical protein BO82DRAFT_355362 [Aspergillus uvarum CBS 121591]
MANTKQQKSYHAWPTDPPIYTQTNNEQVQNITQNRGWNYSLCDCFSPGSLCLTSWCLPCLTFGKTQARIHDPTLQNFSHINTECAIFTCLGLGVSQWIIQTIRRGEMRERFGIEGSCCGVLHDLLQRVLRPHSGGEGDGAADEARVHGVPGRAADGVFCLGLGWEVIWLIGLEVCVRVAPSASS